MDYFFCEQANVYEKERDIISISNKEQPIK